VPLLLVKRVSGLVWGGLAATAPAGAG